MLFLVPFSFTLFFLFSVKHQSGHWLLFALYVWFGGFSAIILSLNSEHSHPTRSWPLLLFPFGVLGFCNLTKKLYSLFSVKTRPNPKLVFLLFFLSDYCILRAERGNGGGGREGGSDIFPFSWFVQPIQNSER